MTWNAPEAWQEQVQWRIMISIIGFWYPPLRHCHHPSIAFNTLDSQSSQHFYRGNEINVENGFVLRIMQPDLSFTQCKG